ncbi:hypothetical protein [Segniliparus rugosus]|nr:hypothetical protein [Segniliparus rugosus]
MCTTTCIPAVLFALLGASAMGEMGAMGGASWQAIAHHWANEEGNAGSAGSGGSDDPTDHGGNGNILEGEDDPVQKEDMSRPHILTRHAEEQADGIGL